MNIIISCGHKGLCSKMLFLMLLLQVVHSDTVSHSASYIQQTSVLQSTTESIGNSSYKGSTTVNLKSTEDVLLEHVSNCPSHVDCNKLGSECIKCRFNYSCVYGQETTVECESRSANCLGQNKFFKTMICRYCYQTESWEHVCISSFNCRVVSNPRERELTNCSVKSDVICLGSRHFRKNPLCNWTDGYKRSTALFLSITLGGFGADRFYLGHWQEGIGKLFSFGGLGIWTLLDVILIAVGYLSPADGSLYI